MGDALKARIKRARFDDPGEEAILNVLVTSRVLLERLEAICSRYGITHNQINILHILRGRYPEDYPLGEADGGCVSSSVSVSVEERSANTVSALANPAGRSSSPRRPIRSRR